MELFLVTVENLFDLKKLFASMQTILFFLETLNKHFLKGFPYLHSPVGYACEVRSEIIFRGFKGKIGFLNTRKQLLEAVF